MESVFTASGSSFFGSALGWGDPLLTQLSSAMSDASSSAEISQSGNGRWQPNSSVTNLSKGV